MRSLVPVLSLAIAASFPGSAAPQTPQATPSARTSFSPTEECFTLKVYAPKGKKFLHPQGGIEKPYVPQQFALRSTCSKAPRMMLPASRHSRPRVKLGK